MSTPDGRQMFSDTVMAEGSKTYHLFRFRTISKCEVPFVEGTYLCSKHCSVIAYSFIFFFKNLFYDGRYCTFLLAPLLISTHFFCFCHTCFFITFRTYLGVVAPNIILLYSGMASKSIRYEVIKTKIK